MNNLQTTKRVGIVFPQAITDDAAFTGATGATPVSVDTKDWSEAAITVMLGATDIAVAAFKVTESDDDSTYTDVPGLDWSSDSTLPTSDDDNKLFTAFIDLKNRKRYLQLTLTAGNGSAGTFAVAWAELAKGDTHPSSAAGRGLADELYAPAS